MISDYYTESIILLDEATSTDPWSTSTGATYSTDVAIPAAVNLLSGNEQFRYDQLGYDAQYKAYSDVSTEIVEGRRCRWNSEDFVIVETPKNTLQRDHHYKFLLRKANA